MTPNFKFLCVRAFLEVQCTDLTEKGCGSVRGNKENNKYLSRVRSMVSGMLDESRMHAEGVTFRLICSSVSLLRI